jgi:dephospho-CoA kinase
MAAKKRLADGDQSASQGGVSPQAAAKPVICLVGGIGSGKSLVAAAFARHGGHVIAADVLGHQALRQPDIRSQVVVRWGKTLLDEQGEVDRRRLGALVFADQAELRALEGLVFPWIERCINEGIAAAQVNPDIAFVVLDAAILLEAGWNGCCDRLVFVDAPREARLRRLAEQRGWSAKEVQARENAQMPVNQKKKRAGDVVDNSGSPEQADLEVQRLLRCWGLAEA